MTASTAFTPKITIYIPILKRDKLLLYENINETLIYKILNAMNSIQGQNNLLMHKKG